MRCPPEVISSTAVRGDALVLAEIGVLIAVGVPPRVEVRVTGRLRQLVSVDGDKAVHPQVPIGGLVGALRQLSADAGSGALQGKGGEHREAEDIEAESRGRGYSSRGQRGRRHRGRRY